jgi:hypothetical protein
MRSGPRTDAEAASLAVKKELRIMKVWSWRRKNEERE